MRKVVRFLQKELGKRLAETVSGSSSYHLLTDGRTLYLETSAQQIVDILKNSRPLRSGKSSPQIEIGFLAVDLPPKEGEMVAELELLSEWIPDQMQPGT